MSGMSSNTVQKARNYYLFLGFHNILLGLFPFFLPVYLFQQGAALSEICYFVALTGVGFTVILRLFDKYRAASYFVPIVLSFFLESLLLWAITGGFSLHLTALINGGYSGMYWTIQRVFFLAGGTGRDSGKRFGNFQIYVLVVLKIGVLFGSLLLEHTGIVSVFLITLFLGSCGVLMFYLKRTELEFPLDLQEQQAMKFSEIVRFKDQYRSTFIFIIDGVFLYIESYFWVISLYLVVGESFVRLGGLVIVLAVLLGIIFYLLKNSIDSLNVQKIFVAAVFLYILSWIMRGTFSNSMDLSWQLSLLLCIGFCTSFFRLAFNKRFFDIAKRTTRYNYIFLKSYYSQLFLGVSFFQFGFLADIVQNPADFLSYSYWLSALLATAYFLYLPVQESPLK